MTQKDIKLALRFLKNNDLYERLLCQKKVNFECLPNEFIDCNFVWDKQIEGGLFWYQLHLNWHLFLFSKGYDICPELYQRAFDVGNDVYEIKIHDAYIEEIRKETYRQIHIITK